MIETAAIVAAGYGSRLNELTAAMPKGFLELGGASLIERSIATLLDCGITRVVIGTGYQARHYEALAAKNPALTTVHSAEFATTGSMYTLWKMRSELREPFLLLESDLLYEPRAIEVLLADARPDVVLASDATLSGDEVYIETDDLHRLVAMSKDRRQLARVNAELVGITKISAETYAGMCAVMEEELAIRPRLDYEYALVEVGRRRPIDVLRVDGLAWCEVDDAQHLKRANEAILPRVEAGLAARRAARAAGTLG